MGKRISLETVPTYFIPIYVNEKWLDPDNVAQDIFTATWIPIMGEAITLNLDIYFHIWEGPDDPDDFGCLCVTGVDDGDPGTVSWVDMDGAACSLSTFPYYNKTVYIIGISMLEGSV